MSNAAGSLTPAGTPRVWVHRGRDVPTHGSPIGSSLREPVAVSSTADTLTMGKATLTILLLLGIFVAMIPVGTAPALIWTAIGVTLLMVGRQKARHEVTVDATGIRREGVWSKPWTEIERISIQATAGLPQLVVILRGEQLPRTTRLVPGKVQAIADAAARHVEVAVAPELRIMPPTPELAPPPEPTWRQPGEDAKHSPGTAFML